MIKKYNEFISENIEMADPATAPSPSPSPKPKTTPEEPNENPNPKPTRPGITPTHVPSEKDAPLFYKKLPLLSNRSLIPSRCKDKLTQVYYLTLSRGIVHYEVMSLVTKLLQENRIDFLVLKGAYLAEKLYKDIGH